jgi:hypothetical protein
VEALLGEYNASYPISIDGLLHMCSKPIHHLYYVYGMAYNAPIDIYLSILWLRNFAEDDQLLIVRLCFDVSISVMPLRTCEANKHGVDP